SSPVIDADGKYYGRIWTHRDITQRKRTEIELQVKTAFLEAQLNSTIDGILVVNMSGHRIFQNQRMVDIFRIPPELLEETEDRPVLEFVLKSIKNPEAFLAKVEYLYSHPDKTSVDQMELADGTILDRYSAPVADEDGRYFGRIWNFRDITERKKSEDKLRQLSVAVEQSSSSIVITDIGGKITYVNRKFTEDTGYTFDEAIGQNSRLLNSGHSPREMYEELWSTILKGEEWRGELCNKKKNGELFWESAAISPIVDENGAIMHFLAVKKDITRQRQLESELRQAQKLEGIGQLAAGIAHEINTPIQFVTDNLTFISESFGAVFHLLGLYRTTIQDHLGQLASTKAAELADAEEKGDLEYISDEVPKAISQSLDGARRVASIVRAMKEFSHPDSAEKTAADLNKGILSTITVARNEWKYVAEVVTHLDEALPHVFCYPGEVNQIILNLIVNSAHSIKDKVKDGEKGAITICTRSCGPFAEITIADTGMGIPEAIQSRIYEPFFTTKEVGKGTGQGLAFAYSVIVKKHQGKIWFETEPGRGTTFFIQLPADPSSV
ncbi:MAG: PAS domain S-box protein, partial [Terracidiphilus sp.]